MNSLSLTENNSRTFIELVKKIISLFYERRKKEFFILFFIIFSSSIIDVFSFGAIIPVIYLINDPSPITSNFFLNLIYTGLRFSGTAGFIFFLLLCIVLIFILKNLFLLYSTYLQNKFTYAVANDIVEDQMIRFYKNDYLDVKKRNSIEYLRCLVEAPQGFAEYLMIPMIHACNELLVVSLIVIGLFIYKPLIILLLMLTIVPVSFILLKLSKRKLQEISALKGQLEKDSYLETIQGIHAYVDIKLFNKEDFFIDLIRKKFRELFKTNADKNLYLFVPRRIIEVLIISTIFIIYGSAIFIFNLSSNELVLILITFATASYRLLPSINEILTNVVKIRTSQFIFNLLEIIKVPEPFVFESLLFNSKIEFKEVKYTYPENEKCILNKLNIVINKGDVIVLTGESGSGKTTIAKILTGFIKPDAGEILIDNKLIQHINQLKYNVAYVTQDFFLLDKTVVENIAIGQKITEIDIKRINHIVESVNLTSLIQSLPLGLYQPIGEMGSKMSGGQQQRLAIARALYKNAPLLVLDEATSSLDKENEREILSTILSISEKENLTVVIITHRAHSVTCFNAMYELQNGELNLISKNDVVID